MFRLWRTEWFERIPPTEQVDFGDGKQVSAADLLEGHARRLTAHNAARAGIDDPAAAQTDQQQIRTVAPTLAPLTELAREVADTLPDTTPTPYFRATLNQALTQTHRQHHAQRVLGIRPTPTPSHHWHNLFIVAFVLTVVSLGLTVVRLPRGRARSSHC